MSVLPPLSLVRPPFDPRPSWSAQLSLAGIPLTVRVSNKSWVGTELKVLHGSRVLASGQDDLYYDGSCHPLLWTEGREAILAFEADPGAGSGPYAALWRIGDRGRRIARLGDFFHADLRAWRSHGIVREIRPRKYATHDIARAFPKAFDDERYRDRRFVASYRYDRRTGRLRLSGVRLASAAEARAWPAAVRFPR